jgi:hypothetical protein
MKKILVILSVVALIGQACGQRMNSTDVPEIIRNSLHEKYGVSKATWDKEENGYEASFKQKGKETSVVFDSKGDVLEIENEISKNELPAFILDIIKKDFAGFKIEEASKIDSKGTITYEAEVEKGKESLELIFDGEKLIKKIAEDETEEKD